jgi:sulfatase maturation enzyme AslB (radical SAM superfamily)
MASVNGRRTTEGRSPEGTPMARRVGLRSLTVIVTSDCNLRCTYCYQNRKRQQRLRWRALRPALDLLLGSRRKTVQLLFTGGEPLLAFPSVRRAVRYVLAHKPDRLTVRLRLTSNGTLLAPGQIRFLTDHDVELWLSADGGALAQRLRGERTYDAVDRLLDQLRREQPEWFRHRLSVAVTLIAPTVPLLADSMAYLLSKGVPNIVLTPALTHQPGWRRDDIRLLDEQFARVFHLCLTHYRQSGLVPLLVFRKRRSERTLPAPSSWLCGAGNGDSLTLDVNGEVSACVLFARSYQRFPDTRLGRAMATLQLGRWNRDSRAGALAGYEDLLRATGLFDRRPAKHSSYGRCGTCGYRRSCLPCPVSIVHQPGNADPDRIPDFVCAFNRVTTKYRRRFPAQVARSN